MEEAIVRPVIMSGGSGKRLWPLSRQSFPKQLLPMVGKESMLQASARRVFGAPFAKPIIVTGDEHRFFVKSQLEEAGLGVEAILLEPCGRNTSAAAALAAHWVLANGEDEILLLMPSDHVVENVHALHEGVRLAIPAAQRGDLVTFGIRPLGPNTQYGYIELGPPEKALSGVRRVSRFVEKPDEAHAREYVESGRFAWNAGIFLFRASTFVEEMRRFLPTTLEAISKAMVSPARDGSFIRPDSAAFAAAENVSIDHGIMEKTSRCVVVPVEMGWSDVGSWEALWKISPRDARNNVIQGDVRAIDCRDSLVRSYDGGLVTVVGLNGMAVIAVRDAIFVSTLDRAADVKLLVDELQKEGRDCVATPAKVTRPWGSFETLDQGPRLQIKRIIVAPGERMSPQKHYNLSEHWVVVQGTAQVTIGGELSMLQENQSRYIPAGTTYTLANPGKAPLELIEVQCSTHLAEDDIVRLDDR